MRILTAYDPPPIPTNQFNWSAWDDDRGADYVTCYGPTEAEAIVELLITLHERDPDHYPDPIEHHITNAPKNDACSCDPGETRLITCDPCEGTGRRWHTVPGRFPDDPYLAYQTIDPCQECDGRGYLEIANEPVELDDDRMIEG